MAATARKLTNCLCQSFEFGEFDGENEAAVSYDTNCGQATHSTFAQGHDAKLVGFLVRAELAGEEIRMVQGGMAISFLGAVGAAAKVSEALALKAQAQLDAAIARIAKKEAREAAKTARASAKKVNKTEAKPEARQATVKIGRWTYEAVIGPVTGDAVYTTKKGEIKAAKPGEYTEV